MEKYTVKPPLTVSGAKTKTTPNKVEQPPNLGVKSPNANISNQGSTFQNGFFMGNSSVDKLLNKNDFQSDSTPDSSSIKSSSVDKLAAKN